MWKKLNNWLDKPVTWRKYLGISWATVLVYIIGFMIVLVYSKWNKIQEFGKRIIHKDSRKGDDIFEV